MAESIKITTQVLTDTAKKIRDINQDMDDKLQNTYKSVQNLKSTWESDGAEAIRQKMEALKPRFEEYKNVIESYAKFLDNTARGYETTESAIQSNANAFK